MFYRTLGTTAPVISKIFVIKCLLIGWFLKIHSMERFANFSASTDNLKLVNTNLAIQFK